MGNPGMGWAALVGKEASGCERTGSREGAVWTGLPVCGSFSFSWLSVQESSGCEILCVLCGGLLGRKKSEIYFS